MSRITPILLILLVFGLGGQAQAYQLTPKVTFTFDDGTKSIYENALPVLANHNLPAMLFGETGPLNSGEDWVMTWDQVRELQNTYNWEIGSHTINHPYLTLISSSQLTQELLGSKQDFAAEGINVKSFATPYGDYNNKVLSEIAKYYESHRAAWGGPSQWPAPYNDYEIISREIANNTSTTTIKSWIDEAIANNQWLVILLHSIVEGMPANPYEYNIDNFTEVIDYVASQPIEVTTISEALNFSNQPNLIPNFTFSQLDGSGWAQNWLRTSETQVTVDTNNHGNVHGPQNSMKIVAGAQQYEAQTDIFNIDGSQQYLMRMYQNVQDLVAGGSAVWINEFDADGAWLGGQWLGGNYANFIGYRYYEYNPSSFDVAKIKVHVFTEINSQLTLYFDSVELRALGGSEPGPFCGDSTVDEGEECDDGNTNTSDVCSNECTYNMIEVAVQTCLGSGELYLYQEEPFQSVDTSFTVQRDQLLMFVNGLTDFEIKVNGILAVPTIVAQEGSSVKVYAVDTTPGDLVSITSPASNTARNVQAYLAQDIANPVYDSTNLEIVFVHQDQQTDNLYLSEGTYSYIYMDKHTENSQGTPDNRQIRVQIEGPIGTIIDRIYNLPHPQPSEGVIVDSYIVAPGQAGNYAITMSADDSVYWPLAYCPEQIEIPGCTDPEALNYDPEATVDDSSCTYDEENPNLVPNFSFEILDNDWAVDWTYLDPNVRIDTQGNGSAPFPLSSLRIVAGSNQRVAVSAMIAIDSSKLYQLSYFQKILNFTPISGTAVWIDEFDENENWVSGSWLGGIYWDMDDGIVSYDYSPTSLNVSKIQIHLFTEENSIMTLFIDSVMLKEKSISTSISTTVEP